MLRSLIIGSDRWRYIVVCNKSMMRKPISNWHHFVLQAQHLYGGRVSCNMVLSKLVMYFHHGKIFFLHLENSSIL
jgi:hypothetical protein